MDIKIVKEKTPEVKIKCYLYGDCSSYSSYEHYCSKNW